MNTPDTPPSVVYYAQADHYRINPMNTYYFSIPEASVLEFVQAPTLLEAKESTTEEWLPYLSQMEWITTDD